MNDYLVSPGDKVKLASLDPADSGEYNHDSRPEAEARTGVLLEKLGELQEKLYADAGHALLLVLQAMDAGGKDGTIKHVLSSVNPQGCQVTSFKVPTSHELARDFLWRVHAEVPPKGYVGVFNRSHYEDVLVTRVHGLVSDELAEKRFNQINDFERMLVENGTAVVKVFLHISRDEQRERLQARLDKPDKHWKFNPGDLEERQRWDEYQAAYEAVFRETSTKHAPWHVIPANHKWYRNLVIASILVDALERMNLKFPAPPEGVDFETLKVV